MMTTNQERRLRLRYELSRLGLSFADLSRKLGVTHSAISLVVAGKSRSARIEQAVADALNCAPEDIWPEYYKKGKVS